MHNTLRGKFYKPVIAFTCILFSLGARAQEIIWNTAGVVSEGVGCHFAPNGSVPQDAWAVSAGNQLSIVYSNLGKEFKNLRRKGIAVSACKVSIPAKLPVGLFISAVDQSILYGLVKTPGVSARIDAISFFARRQLNGKSHPHDIENHLAGASKTFNGNDAVSVPLEELKPGKVRISRDPSPKSHWSRFCRQNRNENINFDAFTTITIDKANPNAEISISVDGHDVSVVVKSEPANCEQR